MNITFHMAVEGTRPKITVEARKVPAGAEDEESYTGQHGEHPPRKEKLCKQ